MPNDNIFLVEAFVLNLSPLKTISVVNETEVPFNNKASRKGVFSYKAFNLLSTFMLECNFFACIPIQMSHF